jgi:hypothetical protein
MSTSDRNVDPIQEWIKNSPPLKWKKRPKPAEEPKPVVALATANPEVPLDRQRERISDATAKLIADEGAKLRQYAEQERQERLVAERQRALDWHMEMKLANEEAERRFMRDLDPCDMGLYAARPFHRE